MAGALAEKVASAGISRFAIVSLPGETGKRLRIAEQVESD
jgi:hypothetical protein